MKKPTPPALSDATCRKILLMFPDGVTITDTDGRILQVTPKALEISGCDSEAEVIGTLVTDWVAPESLEKAQTSMADLFKGVVSADNEYVLLKKDGSRFIGAITGSILLDEHGTPEGMIVTTRDISEKKGIMARIQAQDEQLKRLNRVYAILSAFQKAIGRSINARELFSNACKVAVKSGGFRMAWIGVLNEAEGTVEVKAHAGVARDYLRKLRISLKNSKRGKGPTGRAIASGKHILSNDLEHDPRMKPWKEDALRLGYHSSGAFPLFVKKEIIGSINLYAHEPDFFNVEETRLLDELAADISFALENLKHLEERKKAEKELQLKDHFLSESQRIAHIGSFWGDLKVHFYWSDEMYNIFGVSPDTFTPKTGLFLNLIHPDDRPAMQEWIRACFAGEKPGELVFRAIMPSGEVRFISGIGELSYDAESSRPILTGTAQDITERKQVEEAFHEKADELDRYFESSLDLLCIADIDGYFRRLNPEWSKVLGYSIADLIGKQFLDFVHPDDTLATMEAIATLASQKEVLNFINRYRCKNGDYRWIEWRSYPQGKDIFAVARDITERKQTEGKILDQLNELQRWHKVMIGREERNMELKKEVNDLLNQLGKQKKYR